MNQCYEGYGSEAASNADKLVIQVILEQEHEEAEPRTESAN
jgi:hypothetical protein